MIIFPSTTLTVFVPHPSLFQGPPGEMGPQGSPGPTGTPVSVQHRSTMDKENIINLEPLVYFYCLFDSE